MLTILKMRRYVKVLLPVLLSLMLIGLGGCRSSKNSVKKQNESIATLPTKKKDNLKGVEKKLVEEAMSWMGTPYRYAGSEKGKGTDCSGLVLRVYEDVAGAKLPRNSRKQAEYCRQLKKKDVKAGDLVFFATGKDASVISHVGIMIDDERFVHASTKKGVIISEISTPYYIRTFKMFGRVPKIIADN